jgi:Leucine-rich repeat (LRR) protein
VIDDCDMGANLAALIEDCKTIETLQELHLINMGLNVATQSVLLHLYPHKQLKTLDLSNNHLTSMSEIASLLSNNQVLTEVNLTGNLITTAENFTVLLLGMANNMSVTQLSYDVSPAILPKANNPAGIDQTELTLLEDQVRLNKFIQEHILPRQTHYRVRVTSAIDFSRQTDIGANIQAAMKYFKCTADATKLLLSDCHLDDDALMEITSCLLQIKELRLEELDLSDNLI